MNLKPRERNARKTPWKILHFQKKVRIKTMEDHTERKVNMKEKEGYILTPRERNVRTLEDHTISKERKQKKKGKK